MAGNRLANQLLHKLSHVNFFVAFLFLFNHAIWRKKHIASNQRGWQAAQAVTCSTRDTCGQGMVIATLVS